MHICAVGSYKTIQEKASIPATVRQKAETRQICHGKKNVEECAGDITNPNRMV
jgi:hypothetical protein